VSSVSRGPRGAAFGGAQFESRTAGNPVAALNTIIATTVTRKLATGQPRAQIVLKGERTVAAKTESSSRVVRVPSLLELASAAAARAASRRRSCQYSFSTGGE